MLHQLIVRFVANCRLAGFSQRSIQALSARLHEFNAFLKKEKFRSIQNISYLVLEIAITHFAKKAFILIILGVSCAFARDK